jgi:L-alanine-DL-glutamate epimerase-like enolase superfamily enzyme
VDAIQLDATACGGIISALRITERAAMKAVAVETHWFPELHAHLAAAAPQIQRVEYFLSTDVVNFGALVNSTMAQHSDVLRLSAEPGLGVAVDDVAMKSYSLDL